jgi:hypothetical protein
MSDLTKHDDDQKLRDIAAGLDVEEGIRQGLDDVKKGKVRPAREFSKCSKPSMASLNGDSAIVQHVEALTVRGRRQ